ncbi:MAG: sugar ABC transporter substrate-binding protein [Actinobacteria bacterium]|nr:MAG: sugar ABC transporter substrate-binding protein [Actinomycetota bacterium]
MSGTLNDRSRTILSSGCSRRALLRAGLLGAAGTLLAACSNSPSGQPAAAPPSGATSAPAAAATQSAQQAPASSGGNVDITFITTQTSDADVKIYQQLADTFHQENPNITVKISPTDGTNYDQKLLTYIQANTLPDIVQTSDNFAKPFKDAGITQNMIPFAQKTSFPYQDCDPTFLNLGMIDGDLHMLPKQGDVIIPYVNLRMAQEGGVKVPTDFDPAKDPNGWTWDDFMAMCKHLTVDANGKRGDEPGFDKDNVAIYGASMSIDQWYTYVPKVVAEGGTFVSDDLSKSTLTSPQGVAAFKQLTDPIKDGYWAPLTLIQSLSNQSGNVFAAGRAAIAPLQRLWATTLRASLTDDFDVIHFPKGSAKRVTGMGTFGFALSAKTKHPDEAWSFLSWMYGEEGMRILTASYAAVPAQKRFYQSSFWRDLPPPPHNNAVFVDAFSYGITPPRLPFYSTGEFRQSVTDGMTAITLGKATPEEVVANVDQVLNKYLQQSKA